ncbi:FAD-binding oxidoreductase [Chloroflexota bacterium]
MAVKNVKNVEKAKEEKELLPQEVYREFQAIVGPEHVTTDSVICQAYNARGYAREQISFLGLCTRPACVILPKNTDEVARIVRVCNRNQVPYVPASTMWVIQACPRFRDDFVLIDLKRMDKMEIDEKNMIAVVEPAVIYGQLLEEAMRKDMYTLVPGGGSQAAVIANHLHYGICPLCYRIPLSDYRMNAAEWVTPEGEVVRMGSCVVDDKSWFWQDGLGPNAMGLLRGHIGWYGSLGVVTKMSVKLYPFQPQRMEPAGRSPETHSKLPSSRMRFYNFTLPNREALVTAMDEISRAQIGAAITKVPVFWRVIAKSQDRNDFWDEWEKVTKEEIADTHILRILLIGYTSQQQLEYEERVLTDIMNELGGTLRRTRQTDQSLLKFADSAGMWMMTGGYMSNTAGIDGRRICAKTGEMLGKKLEEYAPPLMPQYNDPGWFQSTDFGHQYYLEFLAYQDPDKLDPDSPKYRKEDIEKVYQWYMSAVPEIEVKTGFYNFFDGQHIPIRLKSPAWHNYDIWCDRFKAEFDPKGVGNPPMPFDIDELAERHPEFITDEVKKAVGKVANLPRKGK